MVKKDFNWIEINILIGIKNCPNLKEITINDIAHQLKMNKSHPYLYRVLAYLIDERIMILKKVIGSVKIFSVDYEKVKDLLDEQERINELINKYLKIDHIFDW